MTITIRNSRVVAIGLGTKYMARNLRDIARADGDLGFTCARVSTDIIVQRDPFLNAKDTTNTEPSESGSS